MPDLNIDDVLAQYRAQLSEANEATVIARAYAGQLERENAELRAELGERAEPAAAAPDDVVPEEGEPFELVQTEEG